MGQRCVRMNDWQYLSLGDLEQNNFPQIKSWGFLVAEYPGSRGSFSKYLVGSKPCLRFDKAPETDLWSHKEETSFLCEKSVQNLNWVADWSLQRPQGINAVTVNLIVSIEKLHRMRLKTGCNCNIHNKLFNPGSLFGDLGFHAYSWKCGRPISV